MTSRRIIAAAAVALALGVAAGCGSSGGDSGGAASTSTPATTTPATTTAGTTTATTSTAGGGGGGAAGDAAAGATVFAANCAGCHGNEGAGGGIGPTLKGNSAVADAAFVKTRVENGKAPMPAWKGVLSATQINDVVAYVSEDLSKG